MHTNKLIGRKCKFQRHEHHMKTFEGRIIDAYEQKKYRTRREGERVLIRFEVIGSNKWHYAEKYLDEIELI